jgi:hypothetical protein
MHAVREAINAKGRYSDVIVVAKSLGTRAASYLTAAEWQYETRAARISRRTRSRRSWLYERRTCTTTRQRSRNQDAPCASGSGRAQPRVNPTVCLVVAAHEGLVRAPIVFPGS